LGIQRGRARGHGYDAICNAAALIDCDRDLDTAFLLGADCLLRIILVADQAGQVAGRNSARVRRRGATVATDGAGEIISRSENKVKSNEPHLGNKRSHDGP
jgi:hypothetical protein